MTLKLDIDLMLPSQMGRRYGWTGEQRLAAAVVERALQDLTISYASTRGMRDNIKVERLHREARDWFLADDHRWPYSFRACCDYLGIDPGAFRAALVPDLKALVA